MAQVWLDTVKLYYEESKAAREQVDGLIDRYRANTATLLTLASAAVALFGFSTGPRQVALFGIAIGSYVVAVATSFLIFKPIPTRVNVAFDTAAQFADRQVLPEKIYYEYACGHQDAIGSALKEMAGTFGIANRFRLLIAASAVLIISAALSVAFGVEQTPAPTHVIIDWSSYG